MKSKDEEKACTRLAWMRTSEDCAQIEKILPTHKRDSVIHPYSDRKMYFPFNMGGMGGMGGMGFEGEEEGESQGRRPRREQSETEAKDPEHTRLYEGPLFLYDCHCSCLCMDQVDANNRNERCVFLCCDVVLGVPKTSTDAEIKKAFRKLAMTHHPDKGGDPEKVKNPCL
jgi:hypothetical protein